MNKRQKKRANAHVQGQAKINNVTTDIGRGKITDNFLAALVTSKAYKMQIVKPKKGKGSFQRKAKHKSNQGQESYLIAA